VGLCPLHRETRPSFYVNASESLFFCHGCGQGGDLIRFVELFRHLSFRQSVANLEQELAAVARSRSVSELLAHAVAFYLFQLTAMPKPCNISTAVDYRIPPSWRNSAWAMLRVETYAAIFLAWAIRIPVVAEKRAGFSLPRGHLGGHHDPARPLDTHSACRAGRVRARTDTRAHRRGPRPCVTVD